MPTKNKRFHLDEVPITSVDTRSDTTRQGYHEGRGSSVQSRSYHPFVDFYNAIEEKSSTTGNKFINTGVAPTVGLAKNPAEIARTTNNIGQFVNSAKSVGLESRAPISRHYLRLKEFLTGKGYRKRLENYYRDKGSSIVTQKTAPDHRIGEQLYNVETAHVKVSPRGKLVDSNGSKLSETVRGVYHNKEHTVQVADDALGTDVPTHEMIHARNRGNVYLDNDKYRMRTIYDGVKQPTESMENYITRMKSSRYFGNTVEQEPRILNTLAAMEREGLDINNLTDAQIYEFLNSRPIDLHGTDTQSLIDNYVLEDIPRALRNFKGFISPLLAGGTGYSLYTMANNK